MAIFIPPANDCFSNKHLMQFWPVRQETKFAEEVLGKVFLGWWKKTPKWKYAFFSGNFGFELLSRTMTAILGPRGKRKSKRTTQQKRSDRTNRREDLGLRWCYFSSVQLLSRVQLCNPMDCSPSGSPVHGTLQARVLERGAMPPSRGSFQPRDWTQVSCIAGGFFASSDSREAIRVV